MESCSSTTTQPRNEAEEVKFILLGELQIPRNPESRVARIFQAVLQKPNPLIYLKHADEDITFLFLQTWIKLKDSGRIREGRMNDSAFHFEYCSFDERFFNFLGQYWAGMEQFRIWFKGSCQINLNKNPEEVIARCFNALGAMHINMEIEYKHPEPDSPNDFCLGFLFFHPKYASHSTKLTTCTSIFDNEDINSLKMEEPTTATTTTTKSFPSIRVDKLEERYVLVDSPLLLWAIKLPNMKFVSVKCNTTSDFILRASKELCQRPTNSMPCSFVHEHHPDFAVTQCTLDNFNHVKSMNLHLSMGYPEVPNMEEWFTKVVLDVLVRCVYLKYLHIFVGDNDKSNCLFFLQGLRKIVARMRPFYLQLHVPNRHQSEDIVIKQIIKLNNEISGMVRNTNDLLGFIVLVSVHTTRLPISSTMAGRRPCPLKMLSVDLFKHLHGFLFKI